MQRRHYHLIGIGGTAMGSLAGLLKAAGHQVTGSDENVYAPMSTQLEALDIRYAQGFAPTNLEPRPDVVVVGNAISRGNPELEYVLDEGLYYTSAAVVIREEFLRGRHVVAVAGTHGKTTTTSILAWILDVAGLDPSFLIGGVAENFGTSFRLTASDYFVIEADEYDTAYFDKGPKMWHYLPRTAIVGNIEFDHADIYRDEEAYRFAFSRFINQVPRSGTLVAGWESPIVRELAPASFAPVASFGFEPQPAAACDVTTARPSGVPAASSADATPLTWAVRDAQYGAELTRFNVVHEGREWGAVETPLTGAYNVRNCLAAIAAAHAVGANAEKVRDALRTFRSVRRRMELRGVVRGVSVIDDFAHHPTAVAETLDAARQRYGERRIIAVFEPRSYTAQRRESQGPYTRALALADEIILAGLFRPERYTKQTALDPDEVIATLRTNGRTAVYIPDVDTIVAQLARTARDGDVIVIMSNGGFGGIHGKLLDALGT